jgi:C4-dicarboxylate-specific signal transduction histidine kinase
MIVCFNWLKSILDDVLELCYERFKYQGVTLKVSGDLETKIRCQETQMAQVLLNLINNAHDAVVNSENPWVHG